MPAPTRPEAPAPGAQLMACLDGRYGRGTVQLAAAVAPAGAARVPWQGQAQWCTPAYTTRLEDLLTVD